MLRRTTPDGRTPGQWLTRHLITSNRAFDKLWNRFYHEMGEYKFVGFDVECVNFRNATTFFRYCEKAASLSANGITSGTIEENNLTANVKKCFVQQGCLKGDHDHHTAQDT
uniref:Uncharacterized protein n=1 Tax=Romanomermis culicivorax TaxID=13658 RepID=A0A915JDQ2_ROMCU